jgi:hypothetical protein
VEHAADEGLVDPRRPVLFCRQRTALAVPVEEHAGLRQLAPRRGELLVVDTEDQHAAGPEQTMEPTEPGAERRLRQMGEEGGDEDRVEGTLDRQPFGIGVGDDPVDPELLLLETHAAGVDVRDPDPLRRDVEHGEAGHPAVAAGEVEQAEAGVGLAEALAEPPAENPRHRLPDPASGVEVEDERPVALLAVDVPVDLQHLVRGVDVEVQAGETPGGETEGGEERELFVSLVGERHPNPLMGEGHCAAAAFAMARLESRTKRF